MLKSKYFATLFLVAFVAFVAPHPVSVVRADTADVAAPNAAINVACVFATGGLGDKSFNDMAKIGLDKAIADGLMNDWGNGSSYAEPDEITEYDGLLENYATAETYDLIVSIGFDQATAVNTTAKAHPTQKIVLIDMVVVQGAVRSVVFDAHQGSFLVGAMAGLVTKTDKLGFIGGMDNFIIRPMWAGFCAGALYKNEDVTIAESFVGDWDDPVTAKSLAQAMYADGIEIIYVAAGKSGLGALEAAGEQTGEKYAIGVDADQDWLHPGKILCSALKRVDVAVYNAAEDVYNDAWTLTTGPVQVLGMAQNGVGISNMTYTRDLVSSHIQEVNVTIRNAIVGGTIVVPSDKDTLQTWLEARGLEAWWLEEEDDEGIPGFTLLAALGGLAVIPILFRRRRK